VIHRDCSQPLAALEFDRDVFSSGQVGSKLWLCEKLEMYWKSKGPSQQPARVWIYGGWQGLLGFLLLAREQLPIEQIRSFDLDAQSTDRANALNENWVWQEWKFRAFTADANQLQPLRDHMYGAIPNLILNTSVEHFPSLRAASGEETATWWANIPPGCCVGLQASDHERQEETSHSMASAPQNFADFSLRFPLREVWWEGEMRFIYDNWTLRRWMRLGRR
jgi:hypothetical protein